MKKSKSPLFKWGTLVLLSASVILTACDPQTNTVHKTEAEPAKAATSVGGGSFMITAPYARAVPPGQPNSAVFMQLQNQDSQNHALVKATSTVAEVVELHTHINEEGVMKMRQVEAIDLPAGQTVELKPGSFHIMLIGLKKPLQINETVELNLTFEEGTTVTTTAPVKEVTAPMH